MTDKERVSEACGSVLRGAGLGLLWCDQAAAPELWEVNVAEFGALQQVAIRAARAIAEGKLKPEAAGLLGLL